MWSLEVQLECAGALLELAQHRDTIKSVALSRVPGLKSPIHSDKHCLERRFQLFSCPWIPLVASDRTRSRCIPKVVAFDESARVLRASLCDTSAWSGRILPCIYIRNGPGSIMITLVTTRTKAERL